MFVEFYLLLLQLPDAALAAIFSVVGAIVLFIIQMLVKKPQTDKDNDFRMSDGLRTDMESLREEIRGLRAQVKDLSESLHEAHLLEIEHRGMISLLELDKAKLQAQAVASVAEVRAHAGRAAAASNGHPGESHTYEVTER